MILMMIMVLNDDGGVDITKMNDPDLRQTEDHKHYRCLSSRVKAPQMREGVSSSSIPPN